MAVQSKTTDSLLLQQPADLFRSLRSRDIPIGQRIKLAQLHWSHESLELEHKQIYFLRWMFETEFYEPKRNSKEKSDLSDKRSNSPVHYPQFWEFLHQLVSNCRPQDLSAIVGGTASTILLRHTLLEWSNLFQDPVLSENVVLSLKFIFPIMSQRLSLDLCLECLNGIFEQLTKVESSTSEPEEKTIILIFNGLLPIIQQDSCYRKALNSLVFNQQALSYILRIVSSAYMSTLVKATVLQIIKSLTLNIENLKKIHSSKEDVIEWLEALRIVGNTNPEIGVAAIEIVSDLLSTLIRDLPNLRFQLFNLLPNLPGPQSNDSRTMLSDSAYLYASRSFILNFMNSSYEVLKDLGSLTTSNLSNSMARLKAIISLIKERNLYDFADPTQHQILDRIAEDCTIYLSDPSFHVAKDSLEILIDLLSLDYTLIEARLDVILQRLIMPAHTSRILESISRFFDGIFDWFSKSKQIPNLFTKLIEICEAKLCQVTLQEISNGPLMDQKIIERAHEEIRLSISSAQMVIMHESLSQKFKTVSRNLLCHHDHSSMEPSPKKRKISATQTSQNKDEAGGEIFNRSDRDGNLCAIISVFYELFVIAASRSPLQTKEWSGLSKKLSTFVDEVINSILLPILQLWPRHQSSQNRFRNWTKSSEQIILASAFRIIASSIQAQGCHTCPELDALNMSDWLELQYEVFGRKNDQLNPHLSFELIHICLEFTSQRLSGLKSIDPMIPQAAYHMIFQLIEHHAELEHSTWNGSVLSLTSTRLPCALWHLLVTAHLSDFSNLATSEQLDQFAKIVFKFGPAAPLQSLKVASTDKESFNFVEVTRIALTSPIIFECTRLREPFLQHLLQAFTHVMALEEGTISAESSDKQFGRVDNLYEILSLLPLSYLTKKARKFLMKWTLLWNDVLISANLPSRDFVASAIRSKTFLLRFFSDPLCAINPEIMKQAVNGIVKFLSYCCGENDEEHLAKVTGSLISVIMARLIKNMKSGEDLEPNFNLLSQLCQALALYIPNVVKTISKSKSITWQDRIIISSLETIAEHATAILKQVNRQPSDGETVFLQRFKQVIPPVLDQLEEAFRNRRVKKNLTLSNLGLLELGKIYLQLRRVNGSQSRLKDCAIDLKLLLSSLKHLHTHRTDSKSSDNLGPTEAVLPVCLDLLDEMIEVHRHRHGMKPQNCRKAFKILIMLHLNFRLKKSIQDDDNHHRFHSRFRTSFIQSCKNSTLQESHEGLFLILDQINGCQELIDSKEKYHSLEADPSPFTRFQILIDLGVLLILNFPALEDRNINHRLDQPEIVFKFLKYLKVIDLNKVDDTENRGHPQIFNFYAWKTELIDQLCSTKARQINRISVLVIIETLIVLSTRKEFQTEQFLYDRLVSIVSHLNQESLRRSLIDQFSIFVVLLSKLMNLKLELRNYSRLINDLSSTNELIGPFSKHSPFLLVVLIQKISQLSSHQTSSSLENFINHGLFSLISTMGKFERSSVGHLILESVHPIHGDPNVLLTWKRILKNWETSRYKGID